MKVYAILFFAFVIGLVIIRSTNEKFMVRRDPSAIRQHYDFTNLKGTALEVAMRERIVSQIEIVKNDNGFGLNLGHFAFRSDNGENLLGCQYFNKVTLIFEAEGAAVNGMKPTMEVDGPCESSEDLTKINAVMIPIKQLMLEHPADGDFNFNQGKPLSMRMLNLPDSWPTMWNLIGVRLNSTSQQFIIDRNEIAKIIGQPLLITVQ